MFYQVAKLVTYSDSRSQKLFTSRPSSPAGQRTKKEKNTHSAGRGMSLARLNGNGLGVKRKWFAGTRHMQEHLVLILVTTMSCLNIAWLLRCALWCLQIVDIYLTPGRHAENMLWHATPMSDPSELAELVQFGAAVWQWINWTGVWFFLIRDQLGFVAFEGSRKPLEETKTEVECCCTVVEFEKHWSRNFFLARNSNSSDKN